MKCIFIVSFAIILLEVSVGCSKESVDLRQVDCIEKQLEKREMVPYDGQKLGCKMYLVLFHYRGEQVFQLNNNCARLTVGPKNCMGISPYKSNNSSERTQYFTETERIGIVGIEME